MPVVSRRLLGVFSVLCYIGLLAELSFLLFYRKVNLDEGWYLWASKLVYSGQMLYRDFAYTQTPLLPYVYGLFQLIFGEGLYQGRILTILFTLLTVVLSAQIAYRIGGKEAALWTLLLFLTSFFTLGYLAYTATYALASLLMVAAIYVTSKSLFESPTIRRDMIYHAPTHLLSSRSRYSALAVILLCMAVATRLSIIVGAAIFACYLLLLNRHYLYSILWILGAGLLSALILFGPFLFTAYSLMLYDIFGFHMDRILKLIWHLKKIYFMSLRTFGIFLVPFLLSFGGLTVQTLYLLRKWVQRATVDTPLRTYFFELTLGLICLALFVIHAVPRTTDSYYHNLQAPLLFILAALTLTRLITYLNDNYHIGKENRYRWVTPTGLVLLFGLNATTQALAVARYDLVQFPPKNQIEIVQEAAAFLQGIDRQDNRLLTFNTHLALEAKMDVPPSYEMSIFAYRPTWDKAQALQYMAVNNELLIEHIGDGADAVALTAFDLERLYGERERIFKTLHEQYRLAKTVPGFDPLHNELYIYLPPQYGLKPATPLPVQLEQGITFLGYDLDEQMRSPGMSIHLGLYWQAEQAIERSYTVSTQILDASSTLVVGWDNPPCQRTCPTNTWLVGEVLRDEYRLVLPESSPPGLYTIQIGLYDSETGTPLPVLTRSSQTTDTRIAVTQIQIQVP